MRILVIHAWLRGNLGDVLQLSVLLSALRELRPRVLDLAGFPARPADQTADVLALSDNYVADPFAWYWKVLPKFVGTGLIEPLWRIRRKALFSRYDAIVCAPGPYLADYDARAPSALSDIALGERARPAGRALRATRLVRCNRTPSPRSARPPSASRASLRPTTYLRRHGISCCLSADLAFLYPYGTAAPGPIEPPYRLIFLRSNNLDARALRLEGGALFEGSRLIAAATRRSVGAGDERLSA